MNRQEAEKLVYYIQKTKMNVCVQNSYAITIFCDTFNMYI